MAEEFQLRDVFSRDVVEKIAGRIAAEYGAFDPAGFVHAATDGMDEISFGDRANLIVSALERFLPGDFRTALEILVSSLGPEPERDELDGYEGFYVMPYTMFVSRYGLEYPDAALPALYEMTKRFTAEGDIRPFIERHPEKTMAFLHDLCTDESPFARRLPSEGTRPRLPLSSRLREFQRDPSPVIEILDRLYDDPSEMVRRSVANNLNDIAKDNPEVTVETLRRWREIQATAPTLESGALERLTRHALRTLIKQSHPAALALLGFETHGLDVHEWSASASEIILGDSLTFSWTMRSTATEVQRFVINYVIHFVKANGRQKEKVFRLPDKTLAPGETITIERKHVFRPYRNQSFFSGAHAIEIEINGERHFRTDFSLTVP